MTRTWLGILAVGASLVSLPAMADGYPFGRPPSVERGRYEWQTVQRWVEPRWESVVTRNCHGGGHHRWRGRGCRDAVQNQFVPGHYEAQQQWVWVSAAPDRDHYGRHYGTHRPPAPERQYGGFGVHLSLGTP
jgi:hypothetical protein